MNLTSINPFQKALIVLAILLGLLKKLILFLQDRINFEFVGDVFSDFVSGFGSIFFGAIWTLAVFGILISTKPEVFTQAFVTSMLILTCGFYIVGKFVEILSNGTENKRD